MKILATILMLVVAIIFGGMTADAKTTKKKTKGRTTQTTSSNWNGGMPSGAYLFKLIDNGGLDSALRSKGYRNCNSEWGNGLIKDGVCMIDYWWGTGGAEWIITVYDTSKLNWLYNGLKQAVAKNKHYDVTKSGNVISVSFDPYV